MTLRDYERALAHNQAELRQVTRELAWPARRAVWAHRLHRLRWFNPLPHACITRPGDDDR